jgi:hypothetical protein
LTAISFKAPSGVLVGLPFKLGRGGACRSSITTSFTILETEQRQKLPVGFPVLGSKRRGMPGSWLLFAESLNRFEPN